MKKILQKAIKLLRSEYDQEIENLQSRLERTNEMLRELSKEVDEKSKQKPIIGQCWLCTGLLYEGAGYYRNHEGRMFHHDKNCLDRYQQLVPSSKSYATLRIKDGEVLERFW